MKPSCRADTSRCMNKFVCYATVCFFAGRRSKVSRQAAGIPLPVQQERRALCVRARCSPMVKRSPVLLADGFWKLQCGALTIGRARAFLLCEQRAQRAPRVRLMIINFIEQWCAHLPGFYTRAPSPTFELSGQTGDGSMCVCVYQRRFVTPFIMLVSS